MTSAIALLALGLSAPPTIDRLGDPRCLVRDQVQRCLMGRAFVDLALRFELMDAATTHADPEVRMRAQSILRKLYPCRDCGGRCGYPVGNSPLWLECKRCHSTGTDWMRGRAA